VRVSTRVYLFVSLCVFGDRSESVLLACLWLYLCIYIVFSRSPSNNKRARIVTQGLCKALGERVA